MRLILLIGAFLLTMNISAQRFIKTPYEAYIDSVALSKLDLRYKGNTNKTHQTLLFNDRIKVTMSTRLNRNIMTKIDSNSSLKGVFSDLDSEDYWSLGAYDVRCKYYLTKRVRLLGRMVITGINTNTYFYSGGFILKF